MSGDTTSRNRSDPAAPRPVGELAAVARPPGTDDVWHAVSAVNVDWTTSDARGWRLIGGRLARVRAAGSRWVGVRWDDVSADACDFANGDWTGGVLQRVDLRDCRFTGANLSECRLTDVRLTGCRLGQTAAHAAIFTRCLFIDCDLRDGDFEGADLRGATFRRCDLRNARLAGARLDGTDLRGSQIAGLWVDVTKIRGVIIDPSQAADLVAVAGVSVRSLTS